MAIKTINDQILATLKRLMVLKADGLYKYIPTWTDGRLASELTKHYNLETPITAEAVKTVRQANGFLLRHRSLPDTERRANIDDRFAALERRVTELENIVTAPPSVKQPARQPAKQLELDLPVPQTLKDILDGWDDE